MWTYNKILQYPVQTGGKNLRMAKNVLTQYGGPDGELGASLRYLTQRFNAPSKEVCSILVDVGTEELGHLEMVGVLFGQLTEGATKDELIAAGLDGYNIEHGCNPFYVNTSGQTFDTYVIGSKGDARVDLYEDLAAEGTMAKEQPTFGTPEKALFHADFRTFGLHTQNRRLRPHKNNNSQNYGRTSCFQGKNHKIPAGI